MEARIDGRRGRGRPTRRWEQDINDWMDMTTTQAGRSYTFPSKGSRSNVSPRDKLIKKKVHSVISGCYKTDAVVGIRRLGHYL